MIQPFAGYESDDLCEYPFEPSALARAFHSPALEPDEEGRLQLPDAPGLGVKPDVDKIRPYLKDVEIRVDGRVLFKSAEL